MWISLYNFRYVGLELYDSEFSFKSVVEKECEYLISIGCFAIILTLGMQCIDRNCTLITASRQ